MEVTKFKEGFVEVCRAGVFYLLIFRGLIEILTDNSIYEGCALIITAVIFSQYNRPISELDQVKKKKEFKNVEKA